MGQYHYKISRDDSGYYFALYPNNNNTQPMGQSTSYESYKTCECALRDFQSFVIINKVDSLDLKFVNEIKENGRYRYEICKDGKVIFYRKIKIEKRVNLKKNIANVYKHIHAELRMD